MVLPRVAALHGLKVTHLGALKETGPTRNHGVQAEVSNLFITHPPVHNTNVYWHSLFFVLM